MQFAAVFIENTAGNVFFCAAKVMITGFIVTACFSSAGKISNFYSCFAVNT